MTIYIEKIDQMIANIEAKDLNKIVDEQVYIPTLGKINNVNQLENWLNKRIGYLEQVKTMTQIQVDTFLNNYYNGLTAEEKLAADKILAGEFTGQISEEVWENTVLFTIYKFITTE